MLDSTYNLIMANTVFSSTNVEKTVVVDPFQAILESAIFPFLRLCLAFFLWEGIENIFSRSILVFTFSSINCRFILPKVKLQALFQKI